ncbi:MAG TPA: HDOD domain-containing protein [Spirochaetota bacterium]|nr:HDOD domain-containing protein [Spirochaetota bacterium]HOS33680.1 HDOD domain-containing protein [Spirochaetota bacterium]HOS56768.1 HDOD domain-containing protein [Spirochaetota bacterium]HPK62334.1 HDOD domain-containing protein [Spirochaetota bacterium]HQF79030.1 HDOD domain-containing protein [Spirochaetota bacterium]
MSSLEIRLFSRNEKLNIFNYLSAFLASFNKERCLYNVYFILNEMDKFFNNSILKRAYLYKKGIKVRSYEEYIKYCSEYENDKNDFEADSDYLLALTRNINLSLDLYIDKEDCLCIVYKINILFSRIEKKSIENSMILARQISNIKEALNNGDVLKRIDKNIYSAFIMIKNLGVEISALPLTEKEKKTEIKFSIPLKNLDNFKDDIISEEISKEIQNIPQYPQHILEAIYILNNPNTNFFGISAIIKKDPAMTADLLKLANSPLYLPNRKIESIEEAVRTIGIKYIKNVVIFYSTKKIFMNKYNLNLIKNIMKHCQEVAFYSNELATKLKKDKELQENAFICGMLHDFGKIIVNSVKPGLIDSINDLCLKNGMNSFSVESIISGYNHSVIGSKLSEKWNFPEFLYEAMRYHHIPHDYRIKNKEVVYTVYLADAIYYYLRNTADFENIDGKILEYFDFQDKNSFKEYCDTIFERYEEFEDKI